MLAVNSLGAASSGARRSASTEATWAPLFDASVIFTSAPNRRWLTATAKPTQVSSRSNLGASGCSTPEQGASSALHQPPISTFDGGLFSGTAIRDCSHAGMTRRGFQQRDAARNERFSGHSLVRLCACGGDECQPFPMHRCRMCTESLSQLL
jgi:hypothetical protein